MASHYAWSLRRVEDEYGHVLALDPLHVGNEAGSAHSEGQTGNNSGHFKTRRFSE